MSNSPPSSATPQKPDDSLYYQLRADLDVSRYLIGDVEQCVVKDPLRLEYFSFAGLECQLLDSLRRPVTISDIRQTLCQIVPGANIAIEEVQRFVNRLISDNLVCPKRLGVGQLFLRQQSQQRRQSVWTALGGLLAIRFRGVNPKWWLDTWAPLGSLLFNRFTLIAISCWFAMSMLLLGLNVHRFAENEFLWSRILSPYQLVPLAIAFIAVKLLHEMGHALACRAHGRECHEMGILLLVFMPCLYCNVSDIWMEPNRWRRILVSSAGILVEMLIASICLPLWLFGQPGEFQILCFNLFLITSVNTLLINGNPLLRFDGYFVLSDLAQVPNLAQRSNTALQKKLDRWLWGLGANESVPNEMWLVLYGFAARCYRVLILISIFTMVITVFRGWELPSLGWIAGGVLAMSLMVGVVWSISQSATRIRKQAHAVHWARFICAMLIVMMIAACILLFPIPTRIVGEGTVRLADSRYLFAPEDGFVEWSNTTRDRPMAETLGQVANREIELELIQSQTELQRLEAELRFQQIQRQQGVNNATEIQITEQLIANLRQIESTLRKRNESLSLTAPISGELRSLAEQIRPADLVPGQLWTSGSPLSPTNRDCFVRRGDILGVVEATGEVIAELEISNQQLDRIQIGNAAWLLIPQISPEYLTGTVIDISLERSQTDPTAPVDEAIEATSFRAVVRVDMPPAAPRFLSPARGIIHGQTRTVAEHLWDYLRANFPQL